jgi:hypothetical protein
MKKAPPRVGGADRGIASGTAQVPDGCRAISVGRDRFAIVDEIDYEKACLLSWELTPNGYPYHREMHGGQQISVLLGRYLTNCPEGFVVSYLNLNPLCCRRLNMRVCTKAQQLLNQFERNNRSGFKGVVKHRRRWTAKAWDETGRKHHIGHFPTAEEAARAYDDYVRPRFGELARYNFPREGERSARTSAQT